MNHAQLKRKEYNSHAYRTNRRIILSFQATCVMCRARGRVKGVQEIDHIVPIIQWYIANNGNMQGCSDISNLQGLCTPCHIEKTNKEKKEYVKALNCFKPRFDINGRRINA